MPGMRVVHTDRLLLRAVRADDLDAVNRIQGDPLTCRYRPGGPSSPAEAQAQLDSWVRHWRDEGFGYWAAEPAGGGDPLGFGGLQHSEFLGNRYLNLYYRFAPAAWGRGLAPEMARAALAWVTEHRADLPVWIVTTFDNEPAMRVADKLGFTEFRQSQYAGAWSRFYRWSSTGAAVAAPATEATARSE